MVEQLGVVQIDSVNVLARSHYLPGFARLGAYDPDQLDRLSHAKPRSVFEYWGHEASLLPVALYPLLRWRMAEPHRWKGIREFGKRKQKLIAEVLAVVRDRGPLGAGELEVGKPRKDKGWWSWSEAKVAVEWLFWTGAVTTSHRRGFERLYDLPERVLPARIANAAVPERPDAIRALVERSARAIGVGTEADLRDYYRLSLVDSRRAIRELVDAKVLEPVTVEGWDKPAWKHRRASGGAVDRDRAALLSPFDSLVWFRERTLRMFGMHYRIEIYTPQPKRVHGYYVLPFLLGDQLAARVDLKADRATRTLLVQASHLEPGAPGHTAPALHDELVRMAAWLGLERVQIEKRGDLAHVLSAHARA